MSLRVYAIVPAAVRAGGTGPGGERLRTIRAGRLGALVGDSTQRYVATRAHLLAYDAVIQRLASRSSALLPARFNTVVADEDELRSILRLRQATLLDALRRVRNRAQMTVRVPLSQGGPDPTSPEASSRQARVRPTRRTSGAAFLRARAASAAERRHVPGFGPARAAVARWVREEQVERRGAVASVYHLIPRASATSYQRALQAAAARHGLRLRISGPWPPYAFANTF